MATDWISNVMASEEELPPATSTFFFTSHTALSVTLIIGLLFLLLNLLLFGAIYHQRSRRIKKVTSLFHRIVLFTDANKLSNLSICQQKSIRPHEIKGRGGGERSHKQITQLFIETFNSGRRRRRRLGDCAH